MNKFEEVGPGEFGPALGDPQVNKFKVAGPGREAGEVSPK